MEGPVPLDQRRPIDANELPVGLAEGFRREVGVEPDQRFPEAALEDDVAIAGIGALRSGSPEADIGPVENPKAQARQPG